jgi:hypothetical protein
MKTPSGTELATGQPAIERGSRVRFSIGCVRWDGRSRMWSRESEGQGECVVLDDWRNKATWSGTDRNPAPWVISLLSEKWETVLTLQVAAKTNGPVISIFFLSGF